MPVALAADSFARAVARARTVAFLSLLVLAPRVWGANHYIVSGASGNGSSWSNAFGDIPSTLVRGDTYFVAGGNYGGHTFNTAASGSTYVYIKKANVTDNSGDPGFQMQYATDPAVFSSGGVVFYVDMAYLSIDGAVGGEGLPSTITTNGYGITLVSTGTAYLSGGSICCMSPACDYLIVKHCECACPFPNGNMGCFNIDTGLAELYPGGSYVDIANCYIHGGLVGVGFHGTGDTLEHCLVADAGGQQHSELIDLASTVNATIRYNVIQT